MNVQTIENSLFIIKSDYATGHVIAHCAHEAIEVYYGMALAQINEDTEVGEEIDLPAVRNDYPITAIELVAAEIWMPAPDEKPALKSV